jgi:hypothetical protein
MSVEGIDVSHWQTSTPSLSGLSFLIARASVGNAIDDKYAMHIGNARKAGLITGAYHFAYHGGIEGQAATFLKAIKAVGNVDLCFIDVEGATAPSQAETRTFIDLVHQAGRKCGLYHSASGFFDAGQDYDWVAKWSPTAPANWTFWQYQGSPLDKDRFNGTSVDLAALAGLPTAPDTSTGEPPMPLIPQALGHVVITATENFFSSPDIGSKLPTTFAVGKVLPKYGGVPGWQMVLVNYGTPAAPTYGWVRSDHVNAAPGALTVIDGPLPVADCSAVQHQLDTTNARIHTAITALGGTI